MRIAAVLLGALVIVGSACRARPAAPPAVRVQLPTGIPSAGQDTAPVTLVEFGSYSCSLCVHFTRDILPGIERRWILPGRLRYVYIDITQPGPLSYAAGLASCLTPAMGLTRAQRWVLDTGLTALNLRAATEDAARRVRVAAPQLVDCVGSYLGGDQRRAERNAADSLGVFGTPTFVIGEERPDGSVVGWAHEGIADPDSLERVLARAERVILAARPR